jgi:hypothetical protein
MDISVFKNFGIREPLTAQFRAEAFNLLNRVVFGSPNIVLSSGQFGVISTQANSPRTIHLALKLFVLRHPMIESISHETSSLMLD